MSTKTKTTKAKAKKENLSALGLPALWERFREATGESTKSPNKKFLVRRIEEALAVRAVEPAPADEPQRPTRTSARATPVPEPESTLAESAPPKPRGRFASMTIEELQTKYLEVVGRSTGSDDRRYVDHADMLSCGTDGPEIPERKVHSAPHIRIKVLPLRMEATVVKRVDGARLRLGLSSRAELFRQALHRYFVGAGEREVADLFLRDGEV